MDIIHWISRLCMNVSLFIWLGSAFSHTNSNRSIWLSSYLCLHYVLWIVQVVLRRKKDLGMQRMLEEPDLGSGCAPAASLPTMPCSPLVPRVLTVNVCTRTLKRHRGEEFPEDIADP